MKFNPKKASGDFRNHRMRMLFNMEEDNAVIVDMSEFIKEQTVLVSKKTVFIYDSREGEPLSTFFKRNFLPDFEDSYNPYDVEDFYE